MDNAEARPTINDPETKIKQRERKDEAVKVTVTAEIIEVDDDRSNRVWSRDVRSEERRRGRARRRQSN